MRSGRYTLIKTRPQFFRPQFFPTNQDQTPVFPLELKDVAFGPAPFSIPFRALISITPSGIKTKIAIAVAGIKMK